VIKKGVQIFFKLVENSPEFEKDMFAVISSLAESGTKLNGVKIN
jgi:hypothetical protein